MKITLTGSLGNVSKPLASQLIAQGHGVTVISNNPEKRKEIEALGAIAAIGSVEDPDFLKSAFAGSDAAYLMVPSNYAAPDARAHYQNVGHSYARAIEQAGVKRIVHLSSWGAHLEQGTGFIGGSHDVEVILNKLSGIEITHLRPGSFFYNLYSFADMIKQVGFIGSNYGDDDKVVMAAPADIADAAAEELINTAGSNKVRYIASEDITATEAARILGKAIGKPELKWVTLTDEQTMEGLQKTGMSEHVAKMLVELGAAIHSGIMREDYDLHPPLRMGKIKLADFAKEFAAAFNAK
ncbi:NAD(P)H-binding protein [Mucilaginibacter terrae]|uniref:NmrA family NAD(P)-binding protein n=1 Tax=Mucilaginibacter terrae TaxID=1955052 RepID=UPI003641B459